MTVREVLENLRAEDLKYIGTVCLEMLPTADINNIVLSLLTEREIEALAEASKRKKIPVRKTLFV